MYILGFLLFFVSCVFSACHTESPSRAFPRIDITSSIPYDSIGRNDELCEILVSANGRPDIDEWAYIHLRGNSTSGFPKRPFLIKFRNDVSVCGMPAARSWVLLANYFDQSMLRNALAFRMAEDGSFDWTPRFVFVEFFFNGEYKGTYQLCEKVQVHPNRLALSDEGWLLEIDGRVNQEKEVFFYTPEMPTAWRIESPKMQWGDPDVERINQRVLQAEEALFGDNFAQPKLGWRKFLDEKSWIDWYLINEITKNYDGNFNSSCYVHTAMDGKLAMGPVWDFDLTCGNINSLGDERLPQGWHIRKTNYYTRLFQDPAFAITVRERFAWFYGNRENYYQFLRSQARILKPHVMENDAIWHTLGKYVGPNPVTEVEYNTYEDYVEFLIGWLEQRFEWMNENL